MKDTIDINIYSGDSCLIAECYDLHFVTEGEDFNSLFINIKEAAILAIQNEDIKAQGIHPDFTLFVHFKLDNFLNE